MSRDRKMLDTSTLILAVLGATGLAFLVYVMNFSAQAKGDYAGDESQLQASVEVRIRPFGDIYLPGEEHEAEEPTVETAIEPEPVATVMSGPQVYNNACIACHGNGVGGAPIVGDTDAWAPRIAQGTATLYDHAINGFTGSAGFMPAKGARVDLSDGEIHNAVDYMIVESM